MNVKCVPFNYTIFYSLNIRKNDFEYILKFLIMSFVFFLLVMSCLLIKLRSHIYLRVHNSFLSH